MTFIRRSMQLPILFLALLTLISLIFVTYRRQQTLSREINAQVSSSDLIAEPTSNMRDSGPEMSVEEARASGRRLDFDSDGVSNYPDNCPTIPNPGQADTDGDGWGDACEGKIANDEMTADQVIEDAKAFDFDRDGTTNYYDNCPEVANPDQVNTDGDGYGDACDK